jgi:hypothetical protein
MKEKHSLLQKNMDSSRESASLAHRLRSLAPAAPLLLPQVQSLLPGFGVRARGGRRGEEEGVTEVAVGSRRFLLKEIGEDREMEPWRKEKEVVKAPSSSCHRCQCRRRPPSKPAARMAAAPAPPLRRSCLGEKRRRRRGSQDGGGGGRGLTGATTPCRPAPRGSAGVEAAPAWRRRRRAAAAPSYSSGHGARPDGRVWVARFSAIHFRG